MCGFIGIFGPDGVDVAPEIYEGLLAVQHRGQDAAGITTFTDRFNVKKGFGLVVEVFDESNMTRLEGNLGVGHVRYPTVGANRNEDAQPVHHTFPIGVAMVHNGNVTNYVELSDSRFKSKMTRLNSTCDLEVLLYVFQQGLAERYQATGGKLEVDDVFSAVKRVYDEVKGAYSVCATIADFGMVAFRDPFGIKPAVFGQKETEDGMVRVRVRERRPRRERLQPHDRHRPRRGGLRRQRAQGAPPAGGGRAPPALHLRVRLLRASRLVPRRHQRLQDATSLRRGARSAVARVGAPMPDAVIPVPDSSRDAAFAFAMELGVPYREGLVKNRYIGRTFIMPNQAARTNSIRRKLNPIPIEFKGKNVVLIDDSVVRGTSRRIVEMVREAGAENVYFGVTSPPLVAPCPYGVDMASKREFVATDRTVDQVAESLGVDHLLYLDRDDMNEAARAGNPKIEQFCNACFTGDYPTPEVTLERLKLIEAEREERRDNVPVA